MIQGPAGSSERPVSGRAQAKVHTRRPIPHGPPQSPTETQAGPPVVGTACWTVGPEPPGTALSAQHGWCSEREAGRLCGALSGDRGTDALGAGPSMGRRQARFRTSAALQLQSSRPKRPL